MSGHLGGLIGRTGRLRISTRTRGARAACAWLALALAIGVPGSRHVRAEAADRGVDVVFAIDRSKSAAGASGFDVGRDGVLGMPRFAGVPLLSVLGRLFEISDPADSVLASQVAIATRMLDRLDPTTTRVGIVVYSGDSDPFSDNAIVASPLSFDFDRVRDALDRVIREGTNGGSDVQAGVRTATVELMGSQSAKSDRRRGAVRELVLFAEGTPSLPLDSRHQNARLAAGAAKKAVSLEIAVTVVSLGASFTDRLTEMTSLSVIEVAGGPGLDAAIEELRRVLLDRPTDPATMGWSTPRGRDRCESPERPDTRELRAAEGTRSES